MRRRRVLASIALCLAVGAPACVQATDVRPDCGAPPGESIFALAAQTVPSATLLPCLDVLLTGWRYEGWEAVAGTFRFWLGSDRAGPRAVQVELLAGCDVSDAVEVVPGADEAGTRRFEEPLSLDPTFAADRFYTFPGGCVRVRYRLQPEGAGTLVLEADQAIGFRPREPIVAALDRRGLVLCGAGAPECPGGD